MKLHSEILCDVDTPLGAMTARVDSLGAVRALRFTEQGAGGGIVPDSPAIPLFAQLKEYFQGQRSDFDLPLGPEGTPFQQKVWAELRRIPFGETVSYLELAQRIGDPKAVRAVARANALNPIAILIPCHRVIGSDGGLTGYAYGLERKAALLKLEGTIFVSGKRQFALFA